MEEKNKPTCFIIQVFDNDKYDKRYYETIKPAIEKAGVLPQRANDILGLIPIIDKIESAIKAANICLAEVTEDNPNVWLEVGYALALNQPTILLCERNTRPKLPFDIQHRPVIYYNTDTKSGFEELETAIIKWVKNELKSIDRKQKVPVIKPGEEKRSNLEDYEIAVLTSTFQYWHTSEGGIASYQLEKTLEEMGFAGFALALGVSALEEMNFIDEKLVSDYNFNEEYKVYFATKAGIQWLHDNKEILTIRIPEKKAEPENSFEDDVPF